MGGSAKIGLTFGDGIGGSVATFAFGQAEPDTAIELRQRPRDRQYGVPVPGVSVSDQKASSAPQRREVALSGFSSVVAEQACDGDFSALGKVRVRQRQHGIDGLFVRDDPDLPVVALDRLQEFGKPVERQFARVPVLGRHRGAIRKRLPPAAPVGRRERQALRDAPVNGLVPVADAHQAPVGAPVDVTSVRMKLPRL